MNVIRFMLCAAAAGILISCGGNDSLSEVSNGETETVSVKPIIDNSTPPLVSAPQSQLDLRRERENRLEKWKEGDALGPHRVPDPPRQKGDMKIKAAPRALGETVPVAPALPSIPADAHVNGTWSPVYNWPLIPIHLAMLPDGKLMSYGSDAAGRQTAKSIYDIYEPGDGLFDGHTTIPKETLADIFCSASLFLSSSDQLLTVGGDNWDGAWAQNTGNNSSNLYTPSTNTLTAANNMKRPRWYASATTLLNGETFIMGGLGGQDRPEKRSLAGVFTLLSGANTNNLDYWYPRNYMNHDGRIFGYDSYGNYYYVNTTGTGSINIVGQWSSEYFGEAGSTAMFRPGQILQLSAFTDKAAVIDIRGASPILTPTQSMATRRQNVNATILPNGTVLATGGSVVYNDIPSANKTAAIWNPNTGNWTIGASGNLARLYHSVGMLMPDGTVFVGGGGAWGPLNNTNVEFYYPPYLFTSGGQLAVKPKVLLAPTAMNVGETIKLTVDDVGAPITRVTMIKTGATTHSFNMEQNFNELSFTRVGNELSVKLPTKATDATPGFYMIFALTAAGTPSQARIARLNVEETTPPPVTPPAAPTALTGTYGTGTGVTLSWTNPSGTVTQNVISRSTSAAGPFTTLATVTARSTYVDANHTVGTWYYQVRAANSGGTGAASNTATVSVTAPPSGNVNAPTGLSGYSCGSGCWTADTGIRFNWTRSSTAGVTQYAVRRATTAAGPWTTVGTLGDVTVYVDKNVVSGTTYYYGVQALTSTAASPWATLNYGVTSNITLGGTSPPPPPPTGGAFRIESQGETRFLVMNWWRGDPAREGNFRQPGICTGIPPAGNCFLGARKTFRPQGFYIENSMLWLEVPQYEGTVNTFDHYALPIELVRTSCTFSIRHIRTHSALEFPLNPPGLEILPHTFTMTQSLCDSYNPASATWVANLNAALDAYLGPDPAPYTPPAYPYNDPRTGRDPSQP